MLGVWSTLVISATWEAEIGGLWFTASQGKKVREIPSQQTR
jgi:hypothetical protein